MLIKVREGLSWGGLVQESLTKPIRERPASLSATSVIPFQASCLKLRNYKARSGAFVPLGPVALVLLENVGEVLEVTFWSTGGGEHQPR